MSLVWKFFSVSEEDTKLAICNTFKSEKKERRKERNKIRIGRENCNQCIMNMFNIELFYLYVSSLTEPEWSTGAHPGTPLRLNLDDSTSNTEDSRLSDSIKTLLSGLAPEYCTCQTCMLPLDHSCCRERERERERERSVNLKHRQLPD